MEVELLFVQEIPEEDKKMINEGVLRIKDVLEEEQGLLEFSFYNPERTYPFTFLGEGNYGIVFQYKQYALKYIKEDWCDELELEEESHIYLALQGVAEVPILYGYADDLLLIEKIQGRDIKDLITSENKQELKKQIHKVGQTILDRGYIPHDVEFYITKDGQFKVLDLGLLESYTNQERKQVYMNEFCERWEITLGIYEKVAG